MTSRLRIVTALSLSGVVLAASCVGGPVEPVDPRIALSDCPHGLYWAECGGAVEPVLGCEGELGDCRWFQGGASARGYTMSDCPATGPCCLPTSGEGASAARRPKAGGVPGFGGNF